MRTGTQSLARLAKVLAGAFFAATLAACAAAVPVAADAAGSAVGKAPDLLSQGKVETHQRVSVEEAIAAARRAAVELDLRALGEEKHPDQLKLIYEDGRKMKIVITLIRRSSLATQIRVDVGIFGDAGMGQLVIRQLMRNLPGPAATEPAPAK
ncbi:MAG TPA: DUF3568 family protein [Phycisphaerae bacterium]|nr:DUF3568 family protein [Phycisphaerae bacterium]